MLHSIFLQFVLLIVLGDIHTITQMSAAAATTVVLQHAHYLLF